MQMKIKISGVQVRGINSVLSRQLINVIFIMKLIRYFITFIILLPFFAHTQDTIRYPVDIVYHEQSEQYYVSNWADNTAGNILKLNSEGQITGTFYDELNYVGGLCLINDILYITNNMDLYGGSQPSYLVGININTGVSILNFEISTGGTYLDLMTTDNNGNLYIGDSEKMKIYKYNLQTGLVTDFVTDITKPFGVFYDYISDRILFTNSSFTNSYIKSKSPQGGEITTVFYHNGYLEGITMDDEGNFYLSSGGNDYQWGNEPVYKTNHDFSWKYEISNDFNRPFGMCIGKDNYLVVCNWGGHTLSFIDLTQFSVEDNITDVGNTKVYPNPSNGQVTISAENLDRQNVKMILCDISGKQVYAYEFKINGNSFIRTFNFENLPKGTYVMVLFNDKFVEREKLIIY